MAIYRRLFFNNVRNFLGSFFPVLKRIYGKAGWAALIREFYTDYRAQTPLFPELSREFLRFLCDGREVLENDPPFLTELAHYEWIRHALSIDERELPDKAWSSPTDTARDEPEEEAGDGSIDRLGRVPVLSPLAWPVSYNYPVHRIRPDFMPEAPSESPTHLLVYRDRKDKIRFMRLNVVSAMLLNKMQDNRNKTCGELLEDIAKEIGHPNRDTVLQTGSKLLSEWQEKDIVVNYLTA